MIKDLKKYFHPETIKRISRLELRSKYVVEGMLSGMHRSPFFGHSVEFRQHRDYVQGDDLRHVDWKLWARQDRLFVKQFEEETNFNCHLLVDTSSSMSYRSGTFAKSDYAYTLACCLAYLVIRQKDCVSCSVFDNRIKETLPARAQSSQLERIAQMFKATTPRSKTSIETVLKSFGNALTKKGLVVLVSDFFVDIEELVTGIQGLRQAGHDVLMLHVLDPDELNFPFEGPTHFEGMESSEEIKCNPAALRESYCQEIDRYCRELKLAATMTASDYEFCTTDMAFNVVLSGLLNRRMSSQNRQT